MERGEENIHVDQYSLKRRMSVMSSRKMCFPVTLIVTIVLGIPSARMLIWQRLVYLFVSEANKLYQFKKKII